MIPGSTMWENILINAGAQSPLYMAAASPTSRVAAECTEGGVTSGDVTFRIEALSGGMRPPYVFQIRRDIMDVIMLGERVVLVRQLVMHCHGTVSGACEWWVRRASSRCPISLKFQFALRGEVLLPSDTFGT